MSQLVLIVDDEPEMVDLLELHLVQNGYEVMTATTGRAALDLIAARPPHLILLDLMLPDVDGLGICEILRHSEATAAIPIVIISAWKSAGARRAGRDLGALAYLAKPFRPEDLLECVRGLLNEHEKSAAENSPAKPGAKLTWQQKLKSGQVPFPART